MGERLKELFAKYDKADEEHSPSRRADVADCIIDELREYVTDERLSDLVEADKEGMCVVLPCKAGDTVYYIADGKVECAVLRAIRVQISPSELTEYVFEGYIQQGKYVYCWVIGQMLFVTEPEAQAALERSEHHDGNV